MHAGSESRFVLGLVIAGSHAIVYNQVVLMSCRYVDPFVGFVPVLLLVRESRQRVSIFHGPSRRESEPIKRDVGGISQYSASRPMQPMGRPSRVHSGRFQECGARRPCCCLLFNITGV